MTDTTTPRTFRVTTKPREGGEKLAYTVVSSDGYKATKVTGRTYQFIVITFGVWGSRWDSKLKQYVHEPHVDMQVVKGTGDRRKADFVFDRECRSLSERAGSVLLRRKLDGTYVIERASRSVVREEVSA